MRARDQVWSEANKPTDADPPAGPPQAEQTVPAQSERPQTQETPSAPAANPPAEETDRVSRLPCVHVLEAFFAVLTTADIPASTADAAEPSRQEAQPGALAAFALAPLLLYQQDRAAEKATGRKGRTRRAVA